MKQTTINKLIAKVEELVGKGEIYQKGNLLSDQFIENPTLFDFTDSWV